MNRQPNREQKKTDPAIIIKQARLEILTLVKKHGLKIIPADFVLEVFEDDEYPKMVRVKNKTEGGERIDTVRVHSREEEDSLVNIVRSEEGQAAWEKANRDKAKKANRKPAFEVANGDSTDSSGSDK